MKVGVTGVKGFVGKAVAETLSAQGHVVIPLDQYTRSNDSILQEKRWDSQDLKWVLHFGASTSIQRSFSDPFGTYENNVNATLKALQIAQKAKAAFIFMSSYVYGKPAYLPIDEKHPVSAENPYMGSKMVCENICTQLCEMAELPLVILRAFNVYGSTRKPGRLISDTIEGIRNSSPITLNDPNPKRDYLYIKDFTSLILSIVHQNPFQTGTFNVGYGKSYSNREVVELALKISGRTCGINLTSSPRPNDIQDCSVNVDLVRKAFSWSPEYSLPDGIKEIIENADNK